MNSPLHIRTHTLGPWATNCYIAWSGEQSAGAPCWIIDAGFDPEPLIADVAALGVVPQAIVLTHAHVDHIAGLDALRAALGPVPIWIHEAEADALGDPMQNLSAFLDQEIIAPPAERTLRDGQTLTLGSESLTVWHTPGHSPGGITLYHAAGATAIVGDTLFADSIGRSDFPTSNHGQLMASLAKLLTLPDDTAVLPGHGEATTIGRERAGNPFLREIR